MLFNILPYKKHIATLGFSILFGFFLLPKLSFGQLSAEKFKVFADSLINVNHTSFSDLDYAASRNKYDTINMRIFEQKSKLKNYIHGEVFANIMIANQYRNKSKFKESKALLNKAVTLSKDNDLVEFEVVALNMIGVALRRQDVIKDALFYHQEALALAEAQKNRTKSIKRSIAVCRNSMGNIYLSLKEHKLALNEFNQALIIEEEAKNKRGLAINYHNIGAIYEEQGDLDKALKNFETSLSYNEEINSNTGRIICNCSIGGIYLKQNKPEAALKIIQPTIALAEKKQDQFYIAWAYNTLGWAQNELGQLAQATKSLQKALDVATKYDLKSAIAEANFHLSDLHANLNNPKLALELYKKANKLDQTIRNEKNSQYVHTLRSRYENEKKNNQITSLANQRDIYKLKIDQNRKTGLFILLGLFLIGGALFLIYRQRQLKSEKKILTLEQDMLRSQMNPHFIFNSLNSIKLYIINNEKENAVYYLNKFSKLIRKILVASNEKVISLKDELETMDLYMNIENIRFSNEIDYTSKANEDINLEAIKVPSLVLQPFLENALWHGLSSKKGEKTIQLSVLQTKEDFVTITIVDNGIGRKASEAIQKNKLLKRKSVGIEITKQRLENFSKNYTNSFNLNVEDLYNGKDALGTKVTIDIPTSLIQKLKTA